MTHVIRKIQYQTANFIPGERQARAAGDFQLMGILRRPC